MARKHNALAIHREDFVAALQACLFRRIARKHRLD
jgi:hypothetical protein